MPMSGANFVPNTIDQWGSGGVAAPPGQFRAGFSEQSRKRYRRKGYKAERGQTAYEVAPASIAATSQRFVQIVEVPLKARNVFFYSDAGQLPAKYRHALQRVR